MFCLASFSHQWKHKKFKENGISKIIYHCFVPYLFPLLSWHFAEVFNICMDMHIMKSCLLDFKHLSTWPFSRCCDLYCFHCHYVSSKLRVWYSSIAFINPDFFLSLLAVILAISCQDKKCQDTYDKSGG